MTSRLWYAVAAAIFLIGAGGAGALVWSGLSGLENRLVRVVVPGRSMLTLDAAGSYTIFHEPESVVDGKLYASDSINGLRVGVREEGGEQVTVTTPNFSSQYSLGGHRGVSVLTFAVAHPGRYELAAAYDSGRREPVAVLAVGQGFVGRLLMTIFAAIGVAAVGTLGALVIGLVTFFRRKKRRGAASAAGPRFC